MLNNLLKLISNTIILASLFMIRTSLSSRHRYIHSLPIAWGISLFSIHQGIERKFIPVQYHHNHNHHPFSSFLIIIIIRNLRRRRCSLTDTSMYPFIHAHQNDLWLNRLDIRCRWHTLCQPKKTFVYRSHMCMRQSSSYVQEPPISRYF